MGTRELLRPLTRVPGLKVAGRTTVRRAAMTTSRWRPNPDFLLIGAKRGGTTSMYRYLLDHPQVLPLFPSSRVLPLADDMKGVHFFDSNWAQGESWYRSHFPSARARAAQERSTGLRAVSGESSPYYLFAPRAAQRAAAVVPQARILLMLRDPVERTYSHWKEQRRRGMETLDFRAALAAESERLAGQEQRLAGDDTAISLAHEHQGYVRQSCYVDGLSSWLGHFSREQVLIVWSDQFYRDAQPVFDDVCRHLAIAERPIRDARRWNETPAAAAIPDDLRAELSATFAPYDDALRDLLKTPLGWDPP